MPLSRGTRLTVLLISAYVFLGLVLLKYAPRPLRRLAERLLTD